MPDRSQWQENLKKQQKNMHGIHIQPQHTNPLSLYPISSIDQKSIGKGGDGEVMKAVCGKGSGGDNGLRACLLSAKAQQL